MSDDRLFCLHVKGRSLWRSGGKGFVPTRIMGCQGRESGRCENLSGESGLILPCGVTPGASVVVTTWMGGEAGPWGPSTRQGAHSSFGTETAVGTRYLVAQQGRHHGLEKKQREIV